MKKLVRYRFKTHVVDDFRPLVDMALIQMPYWCTGGDMDDTYLIIVCYLPEGEELEKYWDDAFDVDCESCDEIKYTDRFKKPSWIK